MPLVMKHVYKVKHYLIPHFLNTKFTVYLMPKSIARGTDASHCITLLQIVYTSKKFSKWKLDTTFLQKQLLLACQQESSICANATFLRFTVNQKCRYATEMIEYVLCWLISRISAIFVLIMNSKLYQIVKFTFSLKL